MKLARDVLETCDTCTGRLLNTTVGAWIKWWWPLGGRRATDPFYHFSQTASSYVSCFEGIWYGRCLDEIPRGGCFWALGLSRGILPKYSVAFVCMSESISLPTGAIGRMTWSLRIANWPRTLHSSELAQGGAPHCILSDTTLLIRWVSIMVDTCGLSPPSDCSYHSCVGVLVEQCITR